MPFPFDEDNQAGEELSNSFWSMRGNRGLHSCDIDDGLTKGFPMPVIERASVNFYDH